MRVCVEHFEYTFYIGAGGVWTMHKFDMSRPHGERYVDTFCNVSNINPFLSEVEYNA